MLRTLLGHPLIRGLDIDDPRTATLRIGIIKSKPFLPRIYEWYRINRDHLPKIGGPVLELGSGAGFLREHIPDVITPEVFAGPNSAVVLEGRELPFANGVLPACRPFISSREPSPAPAHA
ncbi:MAG: hypothetical protein JO145_00470 [Acidobacteriaceae bacterium]|nr:hypothetical protein [Acidobacteriaceae bacterium]